MCFSILFDVNAQLLLLLLLMEEDDVISESLRIRRSQKLYKGINNKRNK